MNNNAHFKILCFGEILWDIFHNEGNTHKVLGGAPSNLCYYFNALGEDATLISQVGKDPLGHEVLQELATLQIPHIISHSNLPTGKVDIILHKGEPQYLFNTPAAWDEIACPDLFSIENTDKLAQADLIAFGSLAHRIIEGDHQDISFTTLTRILKENPNAQRFLDLNLRAPYYQTERIMALLSFADILKINESEFHFLKDHLALDSLSMRDALYAMIHTLHLNFIILTLGENGSIIMSDNDYSAKSALKVGIEDTVGAGDAFSSGFLTALNYGASFNDAHNFANQLSSYICTQKGAFVTIPDHFKALLQQFKQW